ncbi:MAG TPA: hypothetical protein VFP84_11790, partial [Kofleriaceae bacterium]|nr:hypothetical protein [Kofleriaceae bacterium]
MRRSLALLALMFAGIAHAAPVATLRGELDGAPVALELGGDGVVKIGGAAVKVAPASPEGKLALGAYRGQPYVVVSLAREAVILRRDAGAWHEVARTPIGGVGLDHDYGVAVDATPDGVFRYQTRDDIRRCDGKPAYLFADKFDGAKFRRASALPIGVSDGAPVIAARRDGGPAAPPLIYQAHAASYEVGVGDAGGLAIPRELDDGKLDTAWREELAASAGEGQLFTFEPRAGEARAASLRVVAAGKPFNRLRRIAIVAASGAWHAELPDAASEPAGTAFVVDLPQPVAGCVTVIIEATYGAPRGQTAIAELEVFADGERTGGGDALLARVVADGAPGATTAAAALARRGAPGVTAIEAALAATTDRGARQRLVGALAQNGDPSAAPLLVHAATVGWVRDHGLREVIDALGRLDQGQALHDLAAAPRLALEARIAAASAITGFAPLVDLVGHGASDVRRAARTRLAATGKIDELIAAAQ